MTHETIFEWTNTTQSVRIDREHGVLYGVKIIGCRSKNGRLYSDVTLRAAVPLYEGAKVNLNHPDGDPRKPRSYQDRFGIIRNVILKEGDGLFADFHFNPKHPIAEQLMWDAENAPENVGFSHNVEAVVKREGEQVIVEEIVAVRSVDLVADPATTCGLFEQSAAVEQSNNVGAVNDMDYLKAMLQTLLERVQPERMQTERFTEVQPLSREQYISESPLDGKSFAAKLK